MQKYTHNTESCIHPQRREPGASGSLVMPLLTAEQFYAMSPVQLRAVFELAENVEHVSLWSGAAASFHGVRGEVYNRQRGRLPRRFTGWDTP